MSVSELIEKLKELQETHGDLLVYGYAGGASCFEPIGNAWYDDDDKNIIGIYIS